MSWQAQPAVRFLTCLGQQVSCGAGAICSAPHSPNSFPIPAGSSSPSRVAVGGFTAGFHLAKYQGQWLEVCTGVWEWVSLPRLTWSLCGLLLWPCQTFHRSPCWLPVFQLGEASWFRLKLLRTVTSVFAQSLAQMKTGFPGDFGAVPAFHLEAYLTEVQNQHTGTSILVNSTTAQASWHRLATFTLFSSLCL